MNYDKIRKVYLVGICGTAMASLAGLLKQIGLDVAGSDANVYPPMSTQLRDLGIHVYNGYEADNLRKAKPDLVIPGNAVPRGNPEVETMLNLRLPYVSMAEALREFFLREKHSIVIAGTHGKTTTSSLAAWLLQSAEMQPSFLIGGIPLNFGKSFQWERDGKYFVIEGDEYDTGFMDRRPKFVQYLPEIVILNPVEYDHADIYPDFASVENAFWQMIKVVPENGQIIVNRDSDTAYRLATRGYSKVLTFGFHPDSMYRISGEQWTGGMASFQLNGNSYSIHVYGRHNLANAAATVILGEQLGLTPDQIRMALGTFTGVKRRMELRGETNGIAVFDDFAHHPTAINTTLEGARLAFPGSRIWAIFEPRSWSSRRNIFQDEFSRAFRHADLAVIAGVYDAEKLSPEVRLNPDKMVADMNQQGTKSYYIPSIAEIVEFVAKNAKPKDKLVVMSNGSFDGIHDRILERL